MKTDTIKVYNTRDGTQYVRPSDVVMSEKFKRDCEGIRKLFDEMKAETKSIDQIRANTMPLVYRMVHRRCL